MIKHTHYSYTISNHGLGQFTQTHE